MIAGVGLKGQCDSETVKILRQFSSVRPFEIAAPWLSPHAHRWVWLGSLSRVSFLYLSRMRNLVSLAVQMALLWCEAHGGLSDGIAAVLLVQETMHRLHCRKCRCPLDHENKNKNQPEAITTRTRERQGIGVEGRLTWRKDRRDATSRAVRFAIISIPVSETPMNPRRYGKHALDPPPPAVQPNRTQTQRDQPAVHDVLHSETGASARCL